MSGRPVKLTDAVAFLFSTKTQPAEKALRDCKACQGSGRWDNDIRCPCQDNRKLT